MKKIRFAIYFTRIRKEYRFNEVIYQIANNLKQAKVLFKNKMIKDKLRYILAGTSFKYKIIKVEKLLKD